MHHDTPQIEEDFVERGQGCATLSLKPCLHIHGSIFRNLLFRILTSIFTYIGRQLVVETGTQNKGLGILPTQQCYCGRQENHQICKFFWQNMKNNSLFNLHLAHFSGDSKSATNIVRRGLKSQKRVTFIWGAANLQSSNQHLKNS